MSIKYKRIFGIFTAVFIIVACVAVGLTIYMMLKYIDPQTHYYYDNAALVPCVNIFLTAATVFMVIPIFLPRVGANTLSAEKRPVLAVISVLAAASMCILSAYDIFNLVTTKEAAGHMLTAVFGFLSAIFFFALARSLFTGKKLDLRILALLPVVWSITDLVVTFMGLTQMANITQYLYKILQMVFAVLFLYYNARYVGGVPNKRETNGIFAFGLPCAFYGLLASVPHTVTYFITPQKGEPPAAEDIVFLVLSFYIIALIAAALRQKPVVTAAAPESVSDTVPEQAEKPDTQQNSGENTDSGDSRD